MEQRLDIAKTLGTPSALTQEQGDIVFNKICAAIDSNNNIVLDFQNVESMISPFLNVAIGKLYGSYSSDVIQSHLKMTNFPASKNSTLQIVISNAKKYYANKEEYTSVLKDVIDQ